MLLYVQTVNGEFGVILNNIDENSSEQLSEYNKADIKRLLDNIHNQEFKNVQSRIFNDSYVDEYLEDIISVMTKTTEIDLNANEIVLDVTDEEFKAVEVAVKNQKLISENNIEDYFNNVLDLNEESKIFSSIITRILYNYKEYRDYSKISKYDTLLKKLSR